MPKPLNLKTFLPDREVEICQRFREARKYERRGQPEVAKVLDISRARLASYEYAKAPLRYDLANDFCRQFDLSQRWLAKGDGPRGPYITVPKDVRENIRYRDLFSKAFDEHLMPLFTDEAMRVNQTLKNMEAGAGFVRSALEEIAEGWGEDKVPREKIGPIRETLEGLVEFLNEVEESGAVLSYGKDKVDTGAAPAMLSGVTSEVPTWAELKKGALKLTAEHGMKAWLADELEVSRQVVNNWLSTSAQGRPDAVNTLLLLRWVKGGGGKTKIPRK